MLPREVQQRLYKENSREASGILSDGRAQLSAPSWEPPAVWNRSFVGIA